MKILIAILLLLPKVSHAVVVEWYPNLETNIVSYTVKWGARINDYPSNFTVRADVTNALISKASLFSGTNFFVVIATNADGLNSEDSDVLSFVNPPVIRSKPRLIQAVLTVICPWGNSRYTLHRVSVSPVYFP